MTPVLNWWQIVRLGLVQASLGAIVVFATSTLNRVMVIELALPAIVPGALVSIHYAVQMLRPRWGHGSDQGGRQTPWIVAGMAVLSIGSIMAAAATAAMRTLPVVGVASALVGFVLIGIGVGAAGTSLLVLLAKQVAPARRPAAATIVWMMMIGGFIISAAVAGHLLNPFSVDRVLTTSAVIGGVGFVVACLAVRGVEWQQDRRPVAAAAGNRADQPSFRDALREVWHEPEARRFTLFVFLSMLAYSAQELIIEPFAGLVFGLPPAETAKLAGLQHTGLLGGMILVAVLGSAIGGPRLGSMRLWTTGGCLVSALAILSVAASGGVGSPLLLHACVIGLGVANGAFSIAAIGAMMQLAGTGRPGREGVRMGLWGAAQALAFALGGIVGTSTSDVARHLFGSPTMAYAATFVGEAVLFVCAAGLASRAFPAHVGAARREAPPQPALRCEASRWAT